MRPDQLGARSAAQAAANEAAVLAALVAAGDAGLRPGELAERSRLPPRTARAAVRRLERPGLVKREGKRRLWATPAARAEAGAGLPGLALAPALDAALAHFPAEAQRAFCRLLLSAVPARWHLAGSHADGWGGFILLGPSKTGKSTIAKFVCRVYGLDERKALRLGLQETPGSLFGRRVRCQEGYRLERSPLLELPFVCIDEWDKAPEQVRRVASGLLLGQTAAELEGEEIAVRPTVLLCLNSGPAGLGVLHEAYLRRSVVLDTSELQGLLEDMDEAAERLFREAAIPTLSLARRRPPAERLPADVRKQLRLELKANLTPAGWALADVEAISRLALGRAALTAGDLEQAALATALDYLSCAATVGQAEADFALRLGPALGGDGALRPDPASAAAEADQRRVTARRTERETVAARLAFESERERRAAIVAQVRRAMGRPQDVEGRSLAKTLTAAARMLRGCRGSDSLEAAWQAVAPYLEQAAAWRAARAAAEEERRLAREREREARQARREERKRLEGWRARLAALTPYEDERTLMRGLSELGLVRWVPPAKHPDPRAGALERCWQGIKNPGYWVDRTGLRARAPELWRAAYRRTDEAVVRLDGRSKALESRAARTVTAWPASRRV